MTKRRKGAEPDEPEAPCRYPDVLEAILLREQQEGKIEGKFTGCMTCPRCRGVIRLRWHRWPPSGVLTVRCQKAGCVETTRFPGR